MKRKILSLITVLTMLASLIVLPTTAQAETTIKLGDYVQMGTYYGEPILWRCVSFEKISGYDSSGNPIIDSTDTVTEYQDGYLPLMLSDKIICLKSFDASGDDLSGSHARSSYRTRRGSNYWADSNMRSWLNSNESAGNVTWLCENPPAENYVAFNAYDQEAGFLTNFTESELNAVKTVTQKSIVAERDYNNGIYDSGTTYHTHYYSNIEDVANYDDAYSEQVTDTMFLLDVKQVNAVYNNSGILGGDYYIGEPTEECLENSEYTISTENKWIYWLRSPDGADFDYGINVRYIDLDGSVYGYEVDYDLGGVRPAFYLNPSSCEIVSGSGTSSAPYTVAGSGTSGQVTPSPTATPEPDEQHTLTADFYMTDGTGTEVEYITYDSSKSAYSIDSFNLFGDISDKTVFSASRPKNVEITVTLPEGFSFEYSKTSDSSLENRQKTYTYDNFGYKQYIFEQVYVQSPPVGEYTAEVHISGDNVDDADLTFTIPINLYTFEADKYKADYLIFDSNICGPMESTYFNVDDNPAGALLASANESGLGTSTTIWEVMNKSEGLIENPSSVLDLAFEDKDMYEAILWDIFECSSNDVNVVSTLNSIIGDGGKRLIDLVSSDMKNLYKFDVLDGDAIKNMTQEQRDTFMSELSDAVKTEFPAMSKVSDISGVIGDIMDVASDAESVCNTLMAYCCMYALEDSTKEVMKEMYQNCSVQDTALKAALLNCVEVMNASQTELIASMTAVAAGTAGKDIAQALIDKAWDDIKTEVMVMHPAAFAFLAAYKTGTFLSNTLFSTDDITEAYLKMNATVEVQKLAKTSYDKIKSQYKSELTNDEAKVYNSAVDIMFNAMDKGCDAGIAFIDAVGNSTAGKLERLLGDTTMEDKKKQVESIQTSTYLEYESVLCSWVYQLEEDNPEQYEIYKHLIDESNERIYKKYDISCPVDVYVYDARGNLVGRTEGDMVYVDDDADITLSIDGDEKHLHLYDDSEYDISYIGTGSGSMDVAITEYDEQCKTDRTVYFDDLTLSKGTEYSSSDSADVEEYTIESEDGIIYADYDSSIDTEADPHLIEQLNEILNSEIGENDDDTETSYGSNVSSWAKEEMEEAYAEELIPDMLIGEDLTSKVTRDEFAAIAVALYENISGNKAEESQNPFCDISGNAYKSDILKAYTLNIANGISEYEYDPETLISREQVATMLTRAYKRSEFDGWSLDNDSDYTLNYMGVEKFADDDEISDYAKESVYFMVKWGVISGVGDNKFAPSANTTLDESYGYATREQAIAIALRSAKYL